MGEGASGGGSGGSEDRRSTSAPSARPVQRPTQRPVPPAAAPTAAPAPRSGGRGDPRQFGFDPAAAAASRAPRPPVLTPGVDVALLPPRVDEGYSTPSPQPNRMFDTTVAMARPAITAARENVAAARRGGVGSLAVNAPLAALNLADAVFRGGAGLVADLLPGDSRATERSVARGIMALPEAFMGVSPGRVTNVLDDALESAAEAARIRDLGQRIAADEFMARYPSDELGLFEGAYIPTRVQNVDLLQRGQTGNLSPTEQQYLDAMYEADQLSAQGLDPRQVYERTGILSVPLRTITGDVEADLSYGPRLSFTTTPVRNNTFTSKIDRNALNEVFDQNRQARLRDLMLLPENLRGGMITPRRTTVEAKDMGPTTYGSASRLNDSIELNANPAARARADDVLRHEAAHTYLYESNIPSGAAGANAVRAADDARENLARLRSELAAAERDYGAGLIDATQLQEIRNAAAAQRVALLRSPAEIYSENLGEVIARRAGRDSNQVVTVGLAEAFNPYIPTSSGVTAGRTSLQNFKGALRAPFEQGVFSLRRAFERPSADDLGPFNQYGIVARVPANIFERARTDLRAPVYVPPRAPVPTGFPDPFANVSNNQFDFDAFD